MNNAVGFTDMLKEAQGNLNLLHMSSHSIGIVIMTTLNQNHIYHYSRDGVAIIIRTTVASFFHWH